MPDTVNYLGKYVISNIGESNHYVSLSDYEIREWNAAVEDAPYNNPYYGVDLKCAFILMKAIEKGLETNLMPKPVKL